MATAILPTLNREQQQAATEFSRHILLLAGAGTGKTNTLACRVANLLNSGIARPEQILCLTFTNRACREMAERIDERAGSSSAQVVIRTVHSFCGWLLRQSSTRLTDIGADFTICDQPDCLEIIREVTLEAIGREAAEEPATILQNFIGLVKECRFAHPETGAHAADYLFAHQRGLIEKLCIDQHRSFDLKFFHFLERYGRSIEQLYTAKLVRNNTLDFHDLLLRADALLSDPEQAALWQQRFAYIHIDEVQDVSLPEYRLLTRLCGHAKLLLCGDFNQTIYEWRGSAPNQLIELFVKEFDPLVLQFTQNYRASQQLLAVAQNFLHNAFSIGEDSGLSPGSAACTDIEVHRFDTMEDEVAWLYQQIAALHLSDYSRVAIITRNNRACTDVCHLLRPYCLEASSQIRFMLADEFRLFKRAEIKDLLAGVRLLLNPQDGASLRRILTRLVRGVGDATVQAVIAGYKNGLGVALTDFVDIRTRSGDFFDLLLDAMEGGRVVVFDVESTGTDVYCDDIIQMAAVRLAPDGSEAARFERFLRPSRPVGSSEQVHGFSDAYLTEHGVSPATALTEFLDFIEGCVIVGHNVGFDMTITAQNLLRYQVSRPLSNPWYDTLDLSRRFLKKLENHKLCTVAAALHTAHDPSHDAMDDILATADVLNLLTVNYLRPQTNERRAFYAKYLPRLENAATLLQGLRTQTFESLPALLERLQEVFDLQRLYARQPEQLSNLALFCSFAQEYTNPQQPLFRQLSELLELSALSASEMDRLSKTANKVAVITAHQSKGCEFDYVFLPVLQDGIFPSFFAVRDGALEEEKRVFYVSITRAKKRLYLSWARYNTNHFPCKPSPFLELLEPH